MLALLERLEAVRSTGANRWIARCPGPVHEHGDRHPSLSVRLIEGDRWLLNCFGGCRAIDVCAALGIMLGDLFVGGVGHAKRDYQHGKDRNGNPVPRIRAGEFLELAAHEAFVVVLIAADMLAEKPIEPDTWQRLRDAYSRLSRARDEATHA